MKEKLIKKKTERKKKEKKNTRDKNGTQNTTVKLCKENLQLDKPWILKQYTWLWNVKGKGVKIHQKRELRESQDKNLAQTYFSPQAVSYKRVKISESWIFKFMLCI